MHAKEMRISFCCLKHKTNRMRHIHTAPYRINEVEKVKKNPQDIRASITEYFQFKHLSATFQKVFISIASGSLG